MPVKSSCREQSLRLIPRTRVGHRIAVHVGCGVECDRGSGRRRNAECLLGGGVGQHAIRRVNEGHQRREGERAGRDRSAAYDNRSGIIVAADAGTSSPAGADAWWW